MAESNIGGFFGGTPPIPPPQNTPVTPGGPLSAFGLPPEEFVPFGLNHIILIMVPQFKARFRRLPEWMHSGIKISMPITVFFDKLDLGPAFPPLGGLPPPGGLGSPAGGSVEAPTLSTTPGGFASGTYPYSNYDSDHEDPDSDSDDPDGYGNEYYGNEDRALRRKRRKREAAIGLRVKAHKLKKIFQTQPRKAKKRSVPFNRTIHTSERAVLIPRLEKILRNSGLGGKSCLLRAICEVHEAPLDHYGLLGELFTMLFSVSRSMFAESHLLEYLEAERIGRTGNCSEYYNNCKKTIFYWEEKIVYANSI